MRSGEGVGTLTAPSGLDHVGHQGVLGGWPTLRRGPRGPLGRQRPPEQLSLGHPEATKWTFRAQGLVQGKVWPTGLPPISVHKFLLEHTAIPIPGLLSAATFKLQGQD